ncbi:MAG TPA: NAD(P)/FAD-dependent oxidoreductase [Propionibacteriaceae bacterium]|nr:NAD(P)/FAD-dependent oxidoreductase [Propionibacteriaceae bacterium]
MQQWESMTNGHSEIVIVGGGHNGLVAATYLARAGHQVTVLEGRSELGGAVASAQIFQGVAVRLSRFSYLVSLLPDLIIEELGLRLELRSRPVRSFTPVDETGLIVERQEGRLTRDSFRSLTGTEREYQAWVAFQDNLHKLAAVIEPTLTQPLPHIDELRSRVDPWLWASVVARPLGELVESTFSDDTVRGLVLTDALIGTFSWAHDPSLRQNRCFLYHVIGKGSGEWKVPVGGMGAITAELVRVAQEANVSIRTGCLVEAIEPLPSGGGTLRLTNDESITAEMILANCAPATLQRLLGEPQGSPVGSQTKINIVLRRLPQLRSGVEPTIGFAGTLHLGQGYGRLQQAYQEALQGEIPDPMPCEVYCHTLTDGSILDPELRAAGYHTLTLFGMHTPSNLFTADPEGSRERAKAAALRSLRSVLAEPLEPCLALDRRGEPCIEVMTPLDIEAELGMPGGNIFHGDLAWPWLAEDATATTAAERWGVATDHPGILLCGSGAVRGGAVSGLGGHNAAMAVLEDD